MPINKGNLHNTWKGQARAQAQRRKSRTVYKRGRVRTVMIRKRGGRRSWKEIKGIDEIESICQECKEKYLSEWISLSLSPHTHTLESLNIPFKLHSESSPDTLPRKIPEPEEPGGVQPVGVQRARHDWRDSAHTHLVKRASQLVLVVKNPPANAEDIRNMGSIPGLGRSPGGGRGNPLQYSCLESPRGQRSLAGHRPQGHKESDTTEMT